MPVAGPEPTELSTGFVDESAGAILLAAGRGERMGRCKALLPWGDRTLVEAWASRFRAAGVRSVVVVGGHDLDVIRAAAGAGARITWVRNPDPDRSGPRESLLLGLDALPADARAWFTPVDVPVVGEDVLRRTWLAWKAACKAEPGGRGPLAALPSYRRHNGHPVLAGPGLVERLYEGQPGDRIDEVLAWATRRLVVVETDDIRVAGNMNRPEDYEAFAPPPGAAWDWSDAAEQPPPAPPAGDPGGDTLVLRAAAGARTRDLDEGEQR
jgi:CTP:molybdopterin cytidylyltransferase MocA